LTEQHVGHFVFHRELNYDTAQDNIVRVNARQLRTKLNEYFEGAGDDEPWVVEMPKGAYVPRWSSRELKRAAAPSSVENPFWKRVALCLAALSVVLAAALGYQFWPETPNRTPLSVLSLDGNQRLAVVLADSALVIHQALGAGTPPLADYLERKFPRPEWLPDQERPNYFFDILRNRHITDWAGVSTVQLIFETHGEARSRIGFQHPHQFHLRHVAQQNVLFVGGASSIPWAAVFEGDLNFKHGGGRFLNRSPRGNEPSAFIAEDRYGYRGRGFARISWQPIANGPNRAIHVAGTSWLASEIGMRFLLDPKSITELDSRVGPNWRARDSRVELVIETESLEASPGRHRLRAWR
jgi:hypothetical protein